MRSERRTTIGATARARYATVNERRSTLHGIAATPSGVIAADQKVRTWLRNEQSAGPDAETARRTDCPRPAGPSRWLGQTIEEPGCRQAETRDIHVRVCPAKPPLG